MEKLFNLWRLINLDKWSNTSPEEYTQSDETIFSISKVLDK